MGKGYGANWAQKGQGSPHLLHILQVDGIFGVVMAILGLAILVMVVVAVVADLVNGNGAHRFAGLFAFGGAKCPMSNFVCFFLHLTFPGSFVGKALLHKLDGLGQNGLFSSFFSSLYASVFF